MSKKELMQARIYKNWKNPQELIVQHFIFDELKEISRKKDFIAITLLSKKTGFKIELTLYSAIIKALSKKLNKQAKH